MSVNTIKSAQDTRHTSNRSIEARALYFGAGSFILSIVAGLLFFGSDAKLFGGSSSIGALTIMLVVPISIISYIASTYTARQETERGYVKRARFLITTLALAFVHAAIAFLVAAVSFDVIQGAFQGAMLDKYSSTAMVATIGAIAGYVFYLAAAQMTTVKMSSALAIFFIAGAFTSMQTADNPYWWQDHFSSLGAGGTASSYTFNITLIIAGAVIVSLADFISNDFARLRQKSAAFKEGKIRLVRVALSLIGLFLAMVGIFVYNQYPTLHNVATGGMALVFVSLIGALPWLVPFFARAFYVLSYVFVGLIVFCAWLWMGVGYLSLTVFELIAAALIFGWLIIFIRHVAAANDDQP